MSQVRQIYNHAENWWHTIYLPNYTVFVNFTTPSTESGNLVAKKFGLLDVKTNMSGDGFMLCRVRIGEGTVLSQYNFPNQVYDKYIVVFIQCIRDPAGNCIQMNTSEKIIELEEFVTLNADTDYWINIEAIADTQPGEWVSRGFTAPTNPGIVTGAYGARTKYFTPATNMAYLQLPMNMYFDVPIQGEWGEWSVVEWCPDPYNSIPMVQTRNITKEPSGGGTLESTTEAHPNTLGHSGENINNVTDTLNITGQCPSDSHWGKWKEKPWPKCWDGKSPTAKIRDCIGNADHGGTNYCTSGTYINPITGVEEEFTNEQKLVCPKEPEENQLVLIIIILCVIVAVLFGGVLYHKRKQKKTKEKLDTSEKINEKLVESEIEDTS